MTLYYVDSNASGANNGTSWTDAYVSVVAAFAGSVADGDDIWAASDHNAVYTSSTSLVFPGDVSIISVNKTTDAYEAGAKESTSGSGIDLTFHLTDDVAKIFGVEFRASDDMGFSAGGGTFRMTDGLLGTTISSGSTITFPTSRYYIKDSYLEYSSSGNTLAGSGGNLKIDNLKASASHVKMTNLFVLNSSGIDATFINTDLDAIFTTNLVSAFTTSDDYFFVTLKRCKLPTGWSVASSAMTGKNLDIDIRSSDVGDGYHYFFRETFVGITEEDTTVYLAATYDGTNHMSAKMSTKATADTAYPSVHKLVSIPAQDLTSASDVKVNVLTDGVTLTDSEFWIEVVYPDNTDVALGDKVSTRNSDPIAAGTSLTTNSEAWTEALTSPIKQQATASISALSNVDNGLVDVYVYLAKPNTDVWVDLQTVIS